jgi:hypothetical protein
MTGVLLRGTDGTSEVCPGTGCVVCAAAGAAETMVGPAAAGGDVEATARVEKAGMLSAAMALASNPVAARIHTFMNLSPRTLPERSGERSPNVYAKRVRSE